MIDPQEAISFDQRGHMTNDRVIALEGWADTTTVGGVP